MRSVISVLLMCSLVNVVSAELVQLEDEGLESISAQSNGLTIDVDISDLAFTYSYQNDQNASENFWVMGANTGSGDVAVRSDPLDPSSSVGSGAGVVRFNGITVDIGALPDNASIPAIAVGLPSTVELNRVNTGDYYIAHSNPNDADAPPATAGLDPNGTRPGRKLIGLKWNTPPPLDFAAGGQSGTAVNNVINNNFTANTLQMDGQIYIFAN